MSDSSIPMYSGLCQLLSLSPRELFQLRSFAAIFSNARNPSLWLNFRKAVVELLQRRSSNLLVDSSIGVLEGTGGGFIAALSKNNTARCVISIPKYLSCAAEMATPSVTDILGQMDDTSSATCYCLIDASEQAVSCL